MSRFKVVQGPFGKPDEAATHAAFEELVGGPSRGFRLMRIYRDAPTPTASIYGTRGKTKVEVFKERALRDGYTEEEIEAYLMLP